jgi:RNA polymerase sigma-70 factor (ECF subfamily)
MATDASAWHSWLDEHGPSLLLFARQWVASRADAEDIVQEAFARFWRSRHQAREPAAYLYRCVKNCALECLRAGQRRGRRENALYHGGRKVSAAIGPTVGDAKACRHPIPERPGRSAQESTYAPNA